MKPKTVKITYWTLLGIFCLAMTADGIGVSHQLSGHGLSMVIQPLIALMVMLIVYIFWKKYEQIKTIS